MRVGMDSGGIEECNARLRLDEKRYPIGLYLRRGER